MIFNRNSRRFILGCITLLPLIGAPLQRAVADEAPATAHPLDGLVVVEAESSTDSAGTAVMGSREERSQKVFWTPVEGASGGSVITPVPGPFRIYRPFPRPVEAGATVQIPRAGHWYAHVRYMVTPEKFGSMEYRKATKTVKHFHAFAPFAVEINGRKFTAGADQSEGAAFRWDHFELDLPAGTVPVKFLMPDMAGPDCIVFTPNADYKPELADFQGPLWMRFKINKAPSEKFFLYCSQFFNTYEVRRPQDIGWLFKDGVVTDVNDATKAQTDDGRLMVAGQWSPWVRTLEAHKPYPYISVAVMKGDKNGRLSPAMRRRALNNIELVYQAATRPDERFLIRQGAESTDGANAAGVLLPFESDLDAMRTQVHSFSEWAEERLKFVRSLNLKTGEGPRRIRFLTMSNPMHSRLELESFLETCALVGINGLDPSHQDAMDDDRLWDEIAAKGFTWSAAHHLAPVYELKGWTQLAETAPPGKTMQQVVDEFWYGQSLRRIHRLLDGRSEKYRAMLSMADLVDEPGPMPSFVWANCVPVVRGSFHDFLRANGVRPEDLGKKSLDDVDMIGYLPAGREGLVRLMAQMNVDLKFVNKPGPVATEDLIRYRKLPAEAGKPARYQCVVRIVKGLRDTSQQEKRLYYWTQRFRSYFTRHFYGQTARAVEDLAKQGWLRAGILTTPNFQAQPMMEARMWDGGLDLFEWARDGASNALMTEDWINDHYRVGFGLTLLDAARRERGQDLAFLIVADRNFRRRYLMGLGMGVSTFIDYLYGPLGIIGPGWGAHPDMVRDRAEMMRETRAVEDDLTVTKRRPAQTAILVANSSEINSAYYNACAAETGLKAPVYGSRPLFRRAGIFSALLDAGVPVDMISETDILQSKGLDRYKALYVADTHVSRAAQLAIKEWVRGGGVLWADYAALGRDEFDESSDVMNEVFGLSERGVLPPSSGATVRDDEAEAVTGEETDVVKTTANPALLSKAPAIKVKAVSGLEAVSFDGSLFKPAWKLSSAKALATFADGTPALLLNQFGKGQAVLLGCSSLILSPFGALQESDAARADSARRVMTLGADLAHASRFCHTSVPRVNSIVRDGPAQTVVTLINSTGTAQKNLEVRLQLPRAATRAYDSHSKPVSFQQQGDEAIFHCDLAADDGLIVVFR